MFDGGRLIHPAFSSHRIRPDWRVAEKEGWPVHNCKAIRVKLQGRTLKHLPCSREFLTSWPRMHVTNIEIWWNVTILDYVSKLWTPKSFLLMLCFWRNHPLPVATIPISSSCCQSSCEQSLYPVAWKPQWVTSCQRLWTHPPGSSW